MRKRILLSSPHMSDEGYELDFVKEAFETNWIAPLGENVDQFEKEVSDYVGIKAATALVSGTSAIHLALKLAGVQAGDRVFCQTLTFSATANPIIYENAVPVFIDSDYKSWNMDPNKLEEAFIKYPNTKAVLVVHLYGFNADLDRIRDICNKYSAILIEDAAESLGSYYKGRASGTIGKFGIFSFNGNKIITTSGGGMLISNDSDAITKARFWSTQSREPERHYQHNELGYNYRMSNVVAGIGRGQLKVLNKRVEKKKSIYNLYKRELENLEGVSFMPINSWDEPNYWLSSMIITDNSKGVTANKIIEKLEENNIESRPLWKPMHLQPFFEEFEVIGGAVAVDLFNKGLCLPSDTKMTVSEQTEVINIIKLMWEENN